MPRLGVRFAERQICLLRRRTLHRSRRSPGRGGNRDLPSFKTSFSAVVGGQRAAAKDRRMSDLLSSAAGPPASSEGRAQMDTLTKIVGILNCPKCSHTLEGPADTFQCSFC